MKTKQELSEEEIKNLASQLCHPKGKSGIEVAKAMSETNKGMTRAAISSLKISDAEEILEIGHGNGAHISEIFEPAKNIHYTGLDISVLMHQKAQRLNTDLVKSGRVSFHLYEGKKIPFPDNGFDKIMTVNTIYFWEEPLGFLKEVHRVLKKGGRFTIVFVQKISMKKLSFTKYGFKLYNTKAIKNLIAETDFKIEVVHDRTEKVKDRTGKMAERQFTMVCLEK